MRFLHSIVNLYYGLKIHYSFITQYNLSWNPSNNFLIHHLNFLQFYIRPKITHYNYLFVANPQVAIFSNETYNPFTYQKHMMDFPIWGKRSFLVSTQKPTHKGPNFHGPTNSRTVERWNYWNISSIERWSKP